MLEMIRKAAEVPALVSGRVAGGVVVVASFLWLLAQDAIHPLIVYGLELYLSF